MKAEITNYMGSDLTVVNTARVSMDKESSWVAIGSGELHERDKKLINYLTKHNHFTPFTHCMITMRETVPIFVARQRFKHQIGFSYNEVSRRYVDDEPEFYTPEVWRSRPEGSIKQGSGKGEIKNMEDEYRAHIYASYTIYKTMLDAGVAPEQARMVLPQSMYTSYYVTGSLAAWARAYKLRTDKHAQKEIQELAAMWSDIIEPLFPHSWKALTNL